MSDFVPGPAVADARQTLDRIRAAMRASIKGKGDLIDLTLACLMAGGHLLIEDLPGVGKTTLAVNLAWASATLSSRTTSCATAPQRA